VVRPLGRVSYLGRSASIKSRAFLGFVIGL